MTADTPIAYAPSVETPAMTDAQAPAPTGDMVQVRGPHDITGQKFGDLTAIQPERINGARRWKMQCICGGYCYAALGNLKRGWHVNCGCRFSEIRSSSITKHGHNRGGRRSKEYRAWAHIKGRCGRKTDNGFQYYGGRGITMHPAWEASFEAFIAYIGPSPGPSYSVGRIDNERGYVPGNIRWEMSSQQARNTRRTVRIGDEALVDVCDRLGLSAKTVQARLRRGDPPAIALSSLTGSAYRAARKEFAQ